MSDRNLRNARPGAGAAESRPDLMKNVVPGGDLKNRLRDTLPGGESENLHQEALPNGEPADLNHLLASLADDAPDMPADFHTRWTSAVAKEAGNCTQSGVPAGPQAEGIQAAASEAGSDAQGEAPARIWSEKAQMSVLHGAENDVSVGFQSDETQPAAMPARKPAGKIRRLPAAWSRLIGVAAVMVFLVGGTLLTRDSFHAKMSQPVMAPDAGGAVLESAREEESAADADAGIPAAGLMMSSQQASAPTAMPTAAVPYQGAQAAERPALDSVLSGAAAPANGSAYEDADLEEAEEAALSDSSADADAGVPAAGLMMSSYQGAQATVRPALDSVPPGTADAVTEESFDAAMSQEQAAVASETEAENELAEPADESETVSAEEAEQNAYRGAQATVRPALDSVPRGTQTVPGGQSPRYEIEPDKHPVLTFLRDMGLFLRWIAPWALVLAVGVFAGWLAGRRRR